MRDVPPLEPMPEYFLSKEDREVLERTFFEWAIKAAIVTCGLEFKDNELSGFCNELARNLGLPDSRPNREH